MTEKNSSPPVPSPDELDSTGKTPGERKTGPRRNRSFEKTHDEMLRTAVNLIAKKGVDALTIAELAREMRVNRTTVYYHFESREKLVAEVTAWSSMQLADAFRPERPRQERTEHIYRFVLDNPELLRMWMSDLLVKGDIRTMYPYWDELVQGIDEHFNSIAREERVDAEVFCVNLLTSAFIGPQVFKSSVCPDADTQEIVERFKTESLRMLRSDALV